MTGDDTIAVGRRVLETEAAALSRLAAELGETFVQGVEMLFRAKGRIVCTGIGKSGHVNSSRSIAYSRATSQTSWKRLR